MGGRLEQSRPRGKAEEAVWSPPAGFLGTAVRPRPHLGAISGRRGRRSWGAGGRWGWRCSTFGDLQVKRGRVSQRDGALEAGLGRRLLLENDLGVACPSFFEPQGHSRGVTRRRLPARALVERSPRREETPLARAAAEVPQDLRAPPTVSAQGHSRPQGLAGAVSGLIPPGALLHQLGSRRRGGDPAGKTPAGPPRAQTLDFLSASLGLALAVALGSIRLFFGGLEDSPG